MAGPVGAEPRSLSPTITVSYRGNHPFHRWEGRSSAVRSKIQVIGDQLAVPFTVSVPVQSFDSGNRSRDRHAWELLGGPAYPDIVFRVERTSGFPTSPQITLDGMLTLNGVTRPLTVTFVLQKRTDTLRFTGSFPVKLSDFRIPIASFLYIPIDERIDLAFEGEIPPPQ